MTQQSSRSVCEDQNAKDSTPVGLVGLGLLGTALLERARRAGFEILGVDRNSSSHEVLISCGGRAAASIAQVARSCRCIFLSLPDESVAAEVLREMSESLAPGTIVLDSTTGSAETAKQLARQLANVGVTYLDATLSGSSEQLRRGEALFMVGGPQEAFEQCEDMLRMIAGQAMHTGPCGSGVKMKLMTNLVLGLNRAALAEALVFASALGLDREQSVSVLRASAAYSRVIDSKSEKMLNGDFAPQARLSQHLKDVRLMLAAAERSGQKLPLTERHRDLLEQAEALGLGGLDNSAILRVLESKSTDPAS
jgi:3-hydroxyisobutyrate dehydrogenase-like beta-hydroxyacid dehydrogenase